MEERRASDQRRHFERHHFEEEMQALKNRLLNMGALVEERVHDATHALIDRRLETVTLDDLVTGKLPQPVVDLAGQPDAWVPH